MKKWILSSLLVMATTVTGCANTATSSKTQEQRIEAPKTVTLYFARHGKTLFNTADRVQGWADSPLTAEGVQVAKYLGEGLKGIKFDRYYSSDAGRQRETMKVILNQQGIYDYKLNELPGLREAYFGSFEGDFNKTMAAAAAKQSGYASAKELFTQMKAGLVPTDKSLNALAAADPQGKAENYQQVKTRTQQALKTIVDNALRNGDKNILAISSGTAMQAMIFELTDNPDRNKPLSNAAVVKVVYQDGQYSVPEIGNMSYVEAGKKALNGQ